MSLKANGSLHSPVRRKVPTDGVPTANSAAKGSLTPDRIDLGGGTKTKVAMSPWGVAGIAGGVVIGAVGFVVYAFEKGAALWASMD